MTAVGATTRTQQRRRARPTPTRRRSSSRRSSLSATHRRKRHSRRTPIRSTVLESFQATSGGDQGSFSFPGVSGPNLLSTYQAVPAVAGVVFPFNLFVTTMSLPSATVGQHYKAKLHAMGGNAPYTWSVENGFGTLPAGLTLNSSTGVIKGSPQAAGPRPLSWRSPTPRQPPSPITTWAGQSFPSRPHRQRVQLHPDGRLLVRYAHASKLLKEREGGTSTLGYRPLHA